MVSPELERSSSSPSARISELSTEGADGCVLRVRLSDGSLFLLDNHVSWADRLCINLTVGEDTIPSLEALQNADEAYRCRRRALDLLARAEQCRYGLSLKLAKRGFSVSSVKNALDRLEAVGLLDDTRFAESWVRSRLRLKPEGPAKLKSSLAAKGISSARAAAAVQIVLEELGDEDSSEALERAYEKLARRPSMTSRKLTAALIRRGFSPGRVMARIRQGEVGKD